MKDEEDKATHYPYFQKKIKMLILKNPNHGGLVFDISKYILHKKLKINLILLVKTHDKTMKKLKI